MLTGSACSSSQELEHKRHKREERVADKMLEASFMFCTLLPLQLSAAPRMQAAAARASTMWETLFSSASEMCDYHGTGCHPRELRICLRMQFPWCLWTGQDFPALADLGSVAHSAVLSRTEQTVPPAPASLWKRSWDWQHQNHFLSFFFAKRPWQWVQNSLRVMIYPEFLPCMWWTGSFKLQSRSIHFFQMGSQGMASRRMYSSVSNTAEQES